MSNIKPTITKILSEDATFTDAEALKSAIVTGLAQGLGMPMDELMETMSGPNIYDKGSSVWECKIRFNDPLFTGVDVSIYVFNYTSMDQPPSPSESCTMYIVKGGLGYAGAADKINMVNGEDMSFEDSIKNLVEVLQLYNSHVCKNLDDYIQERLAEFHAELKGHRYQRKMLGRVITPPQQV